MDINKYIENTAKKTKKAKLPALSTLSPVLPDGAAGIPNFNASFGGGEMSEDLSKMDINKLKSDIEKDTVAFMLDKGFEESDLPEVLDIEYTENTNIFNISIKADLTISSLRELSDILYPIISKYDDEAYFDISANDSISVDLEMGKDLQEAAKLSSEDRTKLQKFIQTTDDPEEVNIYMKGLLLDEAAEQPDTTILAEINDAYDVLHDLLNQLTGQANRNGNDSLRSSADLALGALDDFESYLRDIEDEFGEAATRAAKEKLPSVDEYVEAFKENYETKEEFEVATDLDFTEYNVADVIYDWITSDTNEDSIDDDMIATDMANEAAEIIMREVN